MTCCIKTLNEIAAPFEMSQPAVSKHLRVLERAGLIEPDVDKQRRPARLKAEAVAVAVAVSWLEECTLGARNAPETLARRRGYPLRN